MTAALPADQLHVQEAPEAAVRAVVAIVPHHEETSRSGRAAARSCRGADR